LEVNIIDDKKIVEVWLTNREKQDEKLEEYGQVTLEDDGKKKIHLLSIIGEVEGHENAPSNSKTTKYDHVLPMLAELEHDDTIKVMLVLLNTSGGDVDAGLAIAEMIASLSMPSVSLVLGGVCRRCTWCLGEAIPSACLWPLHRIIPLSCLPAR